MDPAPIPFELLVLLYLSKIGIEQVYAFFITIGIILLFLLLCFPLYVYVNRVNRERDNEIFEYRFTNHFYKMIKKIFFFLFVILATLLYFLYSGVHSSLVTIASATPAFLSIIILHVIIQVYQFICVILAISKLFSHFFPSSEKFVLFVQKVMHRWIALIYLVFFVKEIASIVIYAKCFLKLCSDEESSNIKLKYSAMFIIFNIISLTSSLLYIPLLISSKKSKIPLRIQLSKPQRYILWQTLTTTMWKIATIPLGVLLYSYRFPIILITLVLILIDFIVIPFIIQLLYLSCNKRNVTVIFKTICCCSKKPSSVQPHYQSNGSSRDA
ncbi:hypothetical protein CRE_28719 [Caenorhabditis remanei]|uniref:Uncharacterized protein n=1 Tax=Caenorhabditis remanei TaxID=31234 RepID=E3MK62_CAERE|nr:hypothetical protein CRE_28719 [Caenorhabditis remanei]